MSIANALGEILRRELEAQMIPLQQAVRRLDEGLEALELLRSVTERLEPLSSRLGAVMGVRTPAALPRPAAARGRRPLGGAMPVRAAGGDSKACAIIGCPRQSRSKGYCSAHYQKLRLLMKTNRRPTAWVDDASPQSVEDVKLPRGRAASKALREGTEAQPVEDVTPPSRRAARKKAEPQPTEDVTPPSRRAARKEAAAAEPAEDVKPRRGRAAGKKAARKGGAAKKAAAKKAPARAKRAPQARKAAGKKAAAKKGARKSSRR